MLGAHVVPSIRSDETVDAKSAVVETSTSYCLAAGSGFQLSSTRVPTRAPRGPVGALSVRTNVASGENAPPTWSTPDVGNSARTCQRHAPTPYDSVGDHAVEFTV